MKEGKQHEHTKRTIEGQAVTGKRQKDNMIEGSMVGQDDDGRSTAGDRLAATANEDPKKDNKKAIE